MKKVTLLMAILLATLTYGQKKTVDYTCFDDWKSVSSYSISDDGNHVLYLIKPQVGNATVKMYERSSGKNLKSSERASNPKFIGNDHFMYIEKPDYDTLRQLKLKKTKKKDLPKNKIVISSVSGEGSIYKGLYKSFQISEKGNTMAWISTEIEKEKCCVGKKKCKCKKPKKKKLKKGEVAIEKEGNTLFYMTFQDTSYVLKRIHYVKSFKLSKDGQQLAYTQFEKKGKESTGKILVMNIKINEKKMIGGPFEDISKMRFSEKSSYLAYTISSDTSKIKTYDLALWRQNDETGKIIVNHSNMDSTKSVSNDRYFYFSKDEEKLFFGIGKRPINEVKDTLLEHEKVKLDLWSWTDKKLQPQQLLQAKREAKKSNLFVWDIQKGTSLQLENDSIRWSHSLNKDAKKYGVASNVLPYQNTYSWVMPWPMDMYLVDIETGEQKLIKKEVKHDLKFSPSRSHYVWYNSKDTNFYSFDLASKQERCLTKEINVNFASDNNGMPFEAYSKGVLGWGPNEEFIYVNSNFDVWKLYPDGSKKPENLTKVGELDSIRFYLRKFESDSVLYKKENLFVESHDLKNHQEFLYIFEGDRLKPVFGGDYKLYDVVKAKNADYWMTRWGNVNHYPELAISDMEFKKYDQITTISMQQDDFNWATVESFFWNSAKGEKLEGLLYKPEDFDSTKKYPLMVYFYEMYSTSKNSYYGPRPSASIINPLEYASNGYIVFIPDVRYEIGHPAQSAFDCIVTGADALVKKFNWIDSTKMALQGQSWGGYQTAQLVTMTDKFKCAMAGAPVSNMFSAYGGIRWGSGMSRMFQYEHTQSRIGATIWEKPELYRENSPIFGLPKVSTPILIMHNDGDGAVPWYQGIEMFVGLRRLNKPAWLMNYNGDQHNLMKRPNRMDLTKRMRSFFDYYLLDKPMPKWMKSGIPAVDKGKDFGFDEVTE